MCIYVWPRYKGLIMTEYCGYKVPIYCTSEIKLHYFTSKIKLLLYYKPGTFNKPHITDLIYK